MRSVLFGALALIGPQLTTTVRLAAKTFDGIRVDSFVPFPARVVVKGELRHWRNVTQGEKGQVIETRVAMVR